MRNIQVVIASTMNEPKPLQALALALNGTCGRTESGEPLGAFCFYTVRAQCGIANRVEITRTQKAPDPASCSKGNLKRLTRCEDAPKSSESEIDIQKPQQWDQSRPATDEAQVCQQWQMRGKMAKNLSCLQSGQVAHWLCDRQHKNLSRLSGKGYGESGYQSDTGMVGRIQRLRVVTSLKIRETK